MRKLSTVLIVAFGLMLSHVAGATYSLEPSIKLADSFAVDAFGKLRTSNSTSQIHIQQFYDKNPLLLDEETVGTGAVAFQSGESSSILSTAADADVAILQSFNHGQYQSGQSQIVKMTFADFATDAQGAKRVGYFECAKTTPFVGTCDGLWLSAEADGNHYVNAYNSGVATTRVARASWDDPLDGSGPSGVTLDLSKAQILVIDFQWLGVGRVRWFFVIDGLPVQFHEMDHANTVTYPYMANPNHPVRWDVVQSGAGAVSMRAICAEVATEGPLDFIGTTRTATNSTTEISGSADTAYALVGVSLQDGKEMMGIIPSQVAVIATSANDKFEWRLCLNPTVADTFTYNAVTNSPAAVAIGVAANTVSDCTSTDGKLIMGGFGGSGAPIDIPSALRRTLGHAIDGVNDKIVLVVQPFAAADFSGSLTWEERY